MDRGKGVAIRTKYVFGYASGECSAETVRALDEAQASGGRRCISAVGHAELAENLRDMPFDRARAQIESRRDFGVRQAMTEQGQDLVLARRETKLSRIGRLGHRYHWRRRWQRVETNRERIGNRLLGRDAASRCPERGGGIWIGDRWQGNRRTTQYGRANGPRLPTIDLRALPWVGHAKRPGQQPDVLVKRQ